MGDVRLFERSWMSCRRSEREVLFELQHTLYSQYTYLATQDSARIGKGTKKAQNVESSTLVACFAHY